MAAPLSGDHAYRWLQLVRHLPSSSTQREANAAFEPRLPRPPFHSNAQLNNVFIQSQRQPRVHPMGAISARLIARHVLKINLSPLLLEVNAIL